jgi:hypothetical protein
MIAKSCIANMLYYNLKGCLLKVSMTCFYESARPIIQLLANLV